MAAIITPTGLPPALPTLITRGPAPWLFLILVAALLYLPGLGHLPVTDRDEPRYATASRQMLETGDPVAIRMGSEARYKKPVGIYWLQAASTGLAQAAGLATPTEIWPQRLVSTLGMTAAMLLLFALARGPLGSGAALAAALMLGASGLGLIEATLAKTDAVLLALLLVVKLALARIWLAWQATAAEGTAPPAEPTTPPGPRWAAPVLWLALGAATLVKGPVAPLVLALALLGLSLMSRRQFRRGLLSAPGFWWRALRPLPWAGLALAVILPWPILAFAQGHGQELIAGLLGDIGPKAVSAHEGHGAPPGAYVVVSMATLWPMAPILLWSLPLWRRLMRQVPLVRFALAWALPVWIFFELMPTKLPHYILPAVPGLAIAAAAALAAEIQPGRWLRLTARLSDLIAAGVALGLAGVIVAGTSLLPTLIESRAAALVFAVVMAGFAALSLWRLWRGSPPDLRLALAVALLSGPLLFRQVLPGIQPLWPSEAAAAAIARAEAMQGGGLRPILATQGFNEPSLMFRVGTRLKRNVKAEAAAAAMAEDPATLVLVHQDPTRTGSDTPDRLDRFLAEAERLNIRVRALTTISAFNLARGGDPIQLTLYERVLDGDPVPPDDED